MPIRYHNFGGKLGWELQKRFPMLSSESYLKLQFLTRNKLQQKYIEYFLKDEVPPMPLVVNLETINRCNSTCSFCTANKNAESVPTSGWRMTYFIRLSTSCMTGAIRDILLFMETMNLFLIQEL